MSNKKKITRYMASLNQDRFFKKVFADLKIAKAFLEDVFDVQIQEITMLEKDKHYITDDAKYVEFDFRCKIDNQYVIIDMQQWHKPDIIHRFYTYHTLNTALQLETLPLKSIIINQNTQKEEEIKDYRRIEPVITLVWLVDDNLRDDGDFLTYSMTPEAVLAFLRDEDLWLRKDINELIIKREKVIKKLKNNTKNLNFIPKNKLIFAFQQNIVNNPKHNKYFNWFKFAELSNRKDNKKTDFNELKKDKPFKKNFIVMEKRLNNKVLSKKDLDYITSVEEREKRVQRYIDGKKEEWKIDYDNDMQEVLDNKNSLIQKAEQDKQKAEQDKQNAEEKLKLKEEKNINEKHQMIIELNNNNVPIVIISNITKLSIDKIKQLIKGTL